MTATTNGHYLNGRPQTGAEQLLDRLNEPRTLEALNRLLDHAELLAFSAASIDGLVRRSDVIVDNVAATVSEFRGSLPAAPAVDMSDVNRLIQQLPHLLELTNQLAETTAKPEFQALLTLASNPTTLESLNQLLRHAELLAFLVTALDGFLQRGELMADSVREMLREVGAGTPDASQSLITLFESLHDRRDYLQRLVYVVPQFTDIIEKLAPFIASPEFGILLSSGVFHPETVTLIGQAGDAFVQTYEQEQRAPRRLGPIGLLRSLNDPDIQRVAALLVDFARVFGKTLKS
jgi:uncharacterized protein YjgD (DUF1641 family)